jgi:hypothetical protein
MIRWRIQSSSARNLSGRRPEVGASPNGPTSRAPFTTDADSLILRPRSCSMQYGSQGTGPTRSGLAARAAPTRCPQALRTMNHVAHGTVLQPPLRASAGESHSGFSPGRCSLESACKLIHDAGLWPEQRLNGASDLRNSDGIHRIWRRGHPVRQLGRARNLDTESAHSIDEQTPSAGALASGFWMNRLRAKLLLEATIRRYQLQPLAGLPR